jgi:long-chain-fatty-acid--CoA ligase ACSBG
VYDLKAGTIKDRLGACRPTIFLGVPRVWEKIAEKMKAIGASTKGLKKKISTWAKAKSLEHGANCLMGGNGEFPEWHGLADVLLHKIKQKLGLDACKFGLTGAAPIAKHTLEYFGQLGIQINEAYGMSECTGVSTISTNSAHVWGSCGFECPGVEVQIFNTEKMEKVPRCKDLHNADESEQGEICYRGRHIMMGYLANPDLGKEHMATIRKKTEEAIDSEGWLHSGDKGTMDERGMLKITGRYKELIIGSGGENIAPVPIEDNIKRVCDAVSNVMMIGDNRKFNTCVVTLKAKDTGNGELPGSDELDGGALGLVEGVTTISEASQNEAYTKLIQDAIVATNNDQSCCKSNAFKIQKFMILPNDFSVSGLELTSTLKLKRSVAEKKYKAQIDKMYDGRKEVCVSFA